MTFVPSPKFDILSATYSDRLLTSSTALVEATSSIISTAAPPSTSINPASSSYSSPSVLLPQQNVINLVVSSTRPLNITTRFEAFSCKKVSSSKFSSAAQNVPAFNQQPPPPPPQSAFSYQTTMKGLNPLLNDEDSQGAEEERQLLSGAGASYSFSNSNNNNSNIDQEVNSGKIVGASSFPLGQSNLNQNASSTSSSSSRVPSSSATTSASASLHSAEILERLVPVTAAIMDAKYALDGYGFEGEVKGHHVSILDGEGWFKLVCALTVQSLPAVGASTSLMPSGSGISSNLGGGGVGGGGSGIGASIVSSGDVAPSLLSSSASAKKEGKLSALSSTVFGDQTSATAEAKSLWRAISDVLVGTNEEISLSTATTTTSTAAAAAAAAKVPASSSYVVPTSITSPTSGLIVGERFDQQSGSGGYASSAGVNFLTSPDSHSKTKDATSTSSSFRSLAIDPQQHGTIKVRSPNTALQQHQQQQQVSTPTAILALSNPSLVFFRLNAPDLDPQRKLGGLSLRSQTATPMATTPICVPPSKRDNRNTVPLPSSSASAFPSTPGSYDDNNHSSSNNFYHRSQHQQASSFGARRDREGNDVFTVGVGGAAANDSCDSFPQSPTSQGPSASSSSGFGSERDVTLSEHLFVYHKRTKMCVAVMTCGK